MMMPDVTIKKKTENSNEIFVLGLMAVQTVEDISDNR